MVSGDVIGLPKSFPSILKKLCVASEIEFDECFSMDDPGSGYEDTILLKKLRGTMIQKGHLRNNPRRSVYTLRETPFSSKIQVCKNMDFEVVGHGYFKIYFNVITYLNIFVLVHYHE